MLPSRVAQSGWSSPRKSWEDADVTTAIVIVLALLGVGIVIDQLFRLRNWLKKSPPRPEDQEPPERE